MNRVVKTVKTYDYGNGVFVEKVNGEIERYWCEDERIAIHIDQITRINKQRCDKHKSDTQGRYCYFVDPIKKNTVVLWKTKTQLLKGIPRALVRLGYMAQFNRYAEKETAYVSSTGPVSNEVAQRETELKEFHKNTPFETQEEMTVKEWERQNSLVEADRIKKIIDLKMLNLQIANNVGPGPVSEEVSKRDAELEEFIKKPSNINAVLGRFKQPTIPHFTEGQNARVSEFANMMGINIDNIMPEVGRENVTVDWVLNEVKKAAKERDENKYKTVPLKSEEVMIVNELDDGNKPLDFVDPPCGDMLKKAHEKQIEEAMQRLGIRSTKTMDDANGEKFVNSRKEIDEENPISDEKAKRYELITKTIEGQRLYGTLFNCIRIFGSSDDEQILSRHIDYLDLHETVVNGFDVAIAIRQTKECAEEELGVLSNVIPYDDVLRLLGVLHDIF